MIKEFWQKLNYLLRPVRDLIKQYRQSKKMVKMLKDENPEKLMKKFKGKLPGI